MSLNSWKDFLTQKGHLNDNNNILLDNVTDYFTFANIKDLAYSDYFLPINDALLLNKFNENVIFKDSFCSNILSFSPYYFTDISFFYNDIELKSNTISILPSEFLNSLTTLTFTKNDTVKIINFFPGFDTHKMLSCLEI